MSRIIIKNLPPQGVSEEELKKHFADIDSITDVKLKFNEFGTFRRFAFVGFKSHDGADKAIEKLSNTFIRNNKIILEVCKAIKESSQNLTPTKSTNRNDKEDDDSVKVDRNSHIKSNKDAIKEALEEVENETEFKEFLSLQRNIGNKQKQVWADDARHEVGTSITNTGETIVSKDDLDDAPKKKKHKRSRGKKKSEKTKPCEVFVHTAKIKGLPEDIRRKGVMDFFKPLKLLSVRLNKRDGVCYVSFKDESDLKFALRKNLNFLGTSRINIWRHDVKKSRVFQEQLKEKAKVKQDLIKKQEASLAEAEPIEESGRLFVRNLNYTCTQEDLEGIFSPYGQLTEVHLPIDKNTSIPKGYAYVEFMFPQNAASAYKELNGTVFQGRNFHLIPSKPKPEPRPDSSWNAADRNQPISSFKREKLKHDKQAAPKGSNWNILFLGQNPLADVVSDMRGMEKSMLLTQPSNRESIAVRMAIGDATVVEDMRKFLISNGIELDSFDNPQTPRSKTVMIVKNLPAGTNKLELSNLFELYGKIGRVILPPNGLTAIVEMDEPTEAKLAFRKLAYSKFKESVLYLEWAPINVFREKSLEDQEVTDLKQLESLQTGSKILVKNVPFEATQSELKKIFASYGELNFVRLPKKIDGQHRGFGFVDYLTKEDALRAFKALCHSTHLYGRKLVLEWAKKEPGLADEEEGKT